MEYDNCHLLLGYYYVFHLLPSQPHAAGRWTERGSGSSLCPESYRMLNQREMAIMLSVPDIKAVLDNTGASIWCLPFV